MKLYLIKKLEGKELTDEKIRDFKRLMISQAGIIFSLFLLEISQSWKFSYHIEIAETVFFTTLGIYVFLLWDMLRNYTGSRWIIIVNLIFIMGVFFLATAVVNPFFSVIDKNSVLYKSLLMLTQISLLAVESSVIYFTLKEFFKKEFNMPIKLWAAACIYLMTGLAFGSFYEIFCIMDVECLGIDFPLRTMALMKRMGYSLMVLSGMGTPYPDATGIIYMISTLESLWGQLFVVLIIGRLMMK